jgi:hypothetical protein
VIRFFEVEELPSNDWILYGNNRANEKKLIFDRFQGMASR